jgi:hypothetical protein
VDGRLNGEFDTQQMEHVLIRASITASVCTHPERGQQPSMAVLLLKVEVCNRVCTPEDSCHLQSNARCDYFAFLCMLSL